MESKKIQGQGYRLGSVCEQELEDASRVSSKTNSELIDDFKNLQVVYSKFSKNIKQENAQLQRNLKQADTDIQQIRSHALQLISEIKRLRKEISVHKLQNNRQQIAMNDYNIKLHDIQNALSEKSKEAKSLQTKVKKLGGNLTSAQKNSSMKEETKLRISDPSEVLFLKYKLAELEQMRDELSLKVSELEKLKLEATPQFSDAPASNKPKLDFSKFLKRRNNMDMDQTERIDAHQSSDIINKVNDEAKPQIPDSLRSTNMKSSTSEDSHADNSQIVETKDFSEDTVSKTDFIGNDQSHSIKTEMAEILPVGIIPIVGNNLFSPKFMYAMLALLIIAVIWLVIVKPI
ncbi:2551_t:CDS:2 [Entrophospora sp. SA101]|nr:2551_t:CDS:2 [Entrophospora sp. SA101]